MTNDVAYAYAGQSSVRAQARLRHTFEVDNVDGLTVR